MRSTTRTQPLKVRPGSRQTVTRGPERIATMNNTMFKSTRTNNERQ
jgi:hypothetical protein